MRATFFLIVFICFSTSFVSCKKEPKKPEKGAYAGTFDGIYTTGSINVRYSTYYFFEIIHSTKKELKLKEEQSQLISTLKKHENDSISGIIAFGNNFGSFSEIFIEGKYDEKTIIGTFSGTIIYVDASFLSEGSFTISPLLHQ